MMILTDLEGNLVSGNSRFDYLYATGLFYQSVTQNQAAGLLQERFGSKYSKHGSKEKNSSAKARCPRGY